MEISKIKVNNTTYDIQDSRVNASDLASILTTGGYNVSGGTTYTAGTGINISNGQISIDNSVYTTSNPPSFSPTYANVSYTATAVNGSGALTLAGTDPIYVVTVTANISSVALTANPSAGHSCHVIFVTDSSDSTDRTVAIAHDATNRVCPAGADLSFTVPKNAGGYVEVDFLNADNKIYVRGV